MRAGTHEKLVPYEEERDAARMSFDLARFHHAQDTRSDGFDEALAELRATRP